MQPYAVAGNRREERRGPVVVLRGNDRTHLQGRTVQRGVRRNQQSAPIVIQRNPLGDHNVHLVAGQSVHQPVYPLIVPVAGGAPDEAPLPRPPAFNPDANRGRSVVYTPAGGGGGRNFSTCTGGCGTVSLIVGAIAIIVGLILAAPVMLVIGACAAAVGGLICIASCCCCFNPVNVL